MTAARRHPAATARALLILAAAAVLLAATSPSVLAATPTPTTGAGAGDPRSPGEGPGLVGDPVFAIVGVLGVVVLAVALSLAYVRLTDGPRAEDASNGRRR